MRKRKKNHALKGVVATFFGDIACLANALMPAHPHPSPYHKHGENGNDDSEKQHAPLRKSGNLCRGTGITRIGEGRGNVTRFVQNNIKFTIKFTAAHAPARAEPRP